MFDLLNKYRAPVLVLCVLLMVSFGVVASLDSLRGGDGPAIEEIGKFAIPGGATVAVTNLDYAKHKEAAYRTGLLEADMRGGGGQSQLAQRIQFQPSDAADPSGAASSETTWAYVVLRELAASAGLKITDRAYFDFTVEGMLKNLQPGAAPPEVKFSDYAKRSEGERDLYAGQTAAAMMRASLRPVERPSFAKVFDKFKSDGERLRAEYVFFDGASLPVPIDPRASAEDRATLEKWFSEEAQRGVRAQKQIAEQGDFEVLYVRFSDVDEAGFDAQFAAVWGPKALEAGIVVSDEDARIRFEGWAESYMGAVSAARAKAATESRPAPASDFDAVKERVKKELTIVKLAEAVFKQTTRVEAAPTFEQVRDLYSFKLATPTKLDAAGVGSQPDFGSGRAQSAIFEGFAEGTLKKGDVVESKEEGYGAKGAFDEPGRSVSIWRVLERRESREPTLDDTGVLDFAVEKYVEKKRQEEAKKLADDFKKALDERVAAAVKELETTLDDESKKAVEAELAAQGLSREKPEDRAKVLQIENQERVKKGEKLDAAKAEREPALFKALVEERALVLRETGPLRRSVARPAQFRPDGAKLPTDEKAARFFRKPARMAALAGLKIGRVGQVESEPIWAAAAVARLVERVEPKPEDLWSLSDEQFAQVERSAGAAQQQPWTYEALKSPAWFGLDAKALQNEIDEAAKRKAEKSETDRRTEARRKVSEMRRAGTLVEAARDLTSPIKSGEDLVIVDPAAAVSVAAPASPQVRPA